MKKWYLSKTIIAAMVMEALAQVTLHMEEVKSAISAHTNTDAGLAFAIAFPAVMVAMRFITTEPIKGVKKNVEEPNERDDLDDQNVDDRDDGDWDSDAGVVGILPKTLSDSDTGAGQRGSKKVNPSKRIADPRSKHRRRVKRRR